MNAKEAYQNCYRIIRLLEQSIATQDRASEDELYRELNQYPCQVVLAAKRSFWMGIDALQADGQLDAWHIWAWYATCCVWKGVA